MDAARLSERTRPSTVGSVGPAERRRREADAERAMTIPVWADSQHDHARESRADRQADAVAARATRSRGARGRRAAGVTAAAPLDGPSVNGAPLPPGVRALLEQVVGSDLSTVRVHTDADNAGAVLAAGARAATVGEDIALAPGEAAPGQAGGLELIAHEVAHVMQQRTTGVRPQFQKLGAKGSEEAPVYFVVTLQGLRVRSPDRMLPGGANTIHSHLAVALRRLAPAATQLQLDQVIDAAVTKRKEGDDTEYENLFYGGWSRGDVIPAEGALMSEFDLGPSLTLSLVASLESLGLQVTLTAEQRKILRLGMVARAWEAGAVAELQRDFPWYTSQIWTAQVNMHSQLLADAAEAEEKAPGRPDVGRAKLLSQLRPPLEVLEETRKDSRVHTKPVTQMNRTEQRHWEGSLRGWVLLWKAEVKYDEMRVQAIKFYWTSADYEPARKPDGHAARMLFLRRFADWVGESSLAVDPKGDYTQQLFKDPGTYTHKPFPAHLVAVPEPVGELRIVPAHADHRYRFWVEFSDVYQAFGRFAYRWDVLEWKTDDTDEARRKAVRDVESGVTDANRRTTGRHSARARDVLYSRLGKDLAHAKADARKIVETLGPASLAIAKEAAIVLGMRTLSTTVRTAVDIITLDRGSGLREQMIMVPGPGLWIIRAVCAPLFDDSSDVHRAPSVAYLPVYAMPQQAMAEQALAEADKARTEEETNRIATRQAFLGMANDPDASPSTRAMAQRMADDARLGQDRWKALEAQRDQMRRVLVDVDKSLADSATSERDRRLLKAEREMLAKQIARMGSMIDTHQGRAAELQELASPVLLVAQLVTDDGHTVPLSLEYARISADKADAAALLDALKTGGDVFVVVSDHTHPKAGWARGGGKTLDQAVRNAVTHLLESRDGYGRGRVAVRLPDGGPVSFRIEASWGQLANETLDDLTTLVTLAALAAAPFTAGASLSILVPVGIVGGVRAAERMYARYDAKTLDWDWETFKDFVDIATAAVGAGAAISGARAGMQVSRIGKIAAVSFNVGSDVTGYVIIGYDVVQQLHEIDTETGLSPGERRAKRMMVLLYAFQGIGMQAATQWLHTKYPQELAAAKEGTADRPPSEPRDTTPPALPPETPRADATPRTVPLEPVPKMEGETPVAPPPLEPPIDSPPTPVEPVDPAAGTADRPGGKPDVDKPPVTPEPAKPVTPETEQKPGESGHDKPPAAIEEKQPQRPADDPAATDKRPATVTPDTETAPKGRHVEPEIKPKAVGPATKPPKKPRKRSSVDGLIGSDGFFKPEYPELRALWDAHADESRSAKLDPRTPREWALWTRDPAAMALLDGALRGNWRKGRMRIFPGARRDAVDVAVHSPAAGSSVPGTDKKWTHRVVKTKDISLRMDNAGEQYWLFPDLVEGEVLILPNGSRVWLDADGAVVDSAPVGKGLGLLRRITRGEEAMFSARDRSGRHVAAGTQRLHGATQPGMGGDAPYSIAGGPQRLNQGFERAGIEMWVRRLRKNAPRGVEYVYTTTTKRNAHGDLVYRHYEVGAIESGTTTWLAKFTIEMKGGGITDADVQLTNTAFNDPGMQRYGAPTLKDQPKSKPPQGDISAHMPPELVKWILEGEAITKEPKVRSPYETEIDDALKASAKLGGLMERAATELELRVPLEELGEALFKATERLPDPALDPEARRVVADLVREIHKMSGIKTRFHLIDIARIEAITRMLNAVAAGEH